MQRFRSMKTLQKFSSVHTQVHNHFNQERHLVTRQVTSRDARPHWRSGAPLRRRSSIRVGISRHASTNWRYFDNASGCTRTTSSAGCATKAAGTIWRCQANASNGKSLTLATGRTGLQPRRPAVRGAVQPGSARSIILGPRRRPVQCANPAAAFAAGRRAVQAQAFPAVRDAPQILRSDPSELGPRDCRHRNRGLLGLHDLGHHRPQALFDRRAAQAPRFPQNRARDPP